MEDVRPLGLKVDLFLVDESRDDGLLVTVILLVIQQLDYGLIRGEVIGSEFSSRNVKENFYKRKEDRLSRV